MKGKTTQVVHEAKNQDSWATFKVESKEVDKPYSNEEKYNGNEIQVLFQLEVQDESWI